MELENINEEMSMISMPIGICKFQDALDRTYTLLEDTEIMRWPESRRSKPACSAEVAITSDRWGCTLGDKLPGRDPFPVDHIQPRADDDGDTD